MASHSKFSPSAAHRWMRCAASLSAGEGEETEYSKWGTECHEIASRLLLTGIAPTNQIDEQVQTAYDYVLKLQEIKGNGILLGVEQYLTFDNILPEGLESQGGTVDAVCLSADFEELQIHDLKTGRGVAVYAKDNEQLMLYAIAAVHHFGAVGNIKRVRMCIHQQRKDGHYDEHTIHLDELAYFAMDAAKIIAQRVREQDYVEKNQKDVELVETPGEKQCRWCPRKAECKAYALFVQDAVAAGFDDLSGLVEDANTMGANRLSVAMAAVPMIEQWCLAIRAAVEKELLAGHPIDGFKLVRGRRGPRAWADEAAAIKMLKGMRLKDDQMYTKKVITPPAAEKLVKTKAISEKQFDRLESIITQSEGSLSVAPATDPRPAQSSVADPNDFADLTGA